jgi:hypothetical protein
VDFDDFCEVLLFGCSELEKADWSKYQDVGLEWP